MHKVATLTVRATPSRKERLALLRLVFVINFLTLPQFINPMSELATLLIFTVSSVEVILA